MTERDTLKFIVSNDDKDMRQTLRSVYEALTEKGYNPINQIVGGHSLRAGHQVRTAVRARLIPVKSAAGVRKNTGGFVFYSSDRICFL